MSKDLKIAQCNTRRSISVHDALLSLAFENDIDIVLVQEPWIHSELELRRTRAHSGFRAVVAEGTWKDRPRVATYVRLGRHLHFEQLCSQSPRDILHLRCILPDGFTITVTNIYNAPVGSTGQGDALSTIMDRQIFRGRWLLAGDFNLPYSPWDRRDGSPPTQAAAWEQWAADAGLSSLETGDAPTHDAGGVLDLVWASQRLLEDGAYSAISDDLEAGSDHRSLLTVIPRCSTFAGQSRGGFAHLSTDEKVFRRALKDSLQAGVETDLRSSDDLDKEASSLLEGIQSALAQSTKRRGSGGKALPYWNEECRQARDDLRKAQGALRSASDPTDIAASTTWVQQARRALRRTLAHSRRSHWLSKVEAARLPEDVCRLANWRRREFRCATSSLINPADQTRCETLQQKQDLLMLTFTDPEGLAPDDLSLPDTSEAEEAIPFPPITLQESTTACIGVDSTTPGLDDVSVSTLKLAWPQIGSRVTRLFQGCLEHGHHPACFKQANILVIPKPGKRDKSNPRSYRPISLLSVLGKGLERVVAKRMAWLAVTQRIVGQNQFGALPLRAASDLTTAVTHDIELAWSQGEAASMVTLDVKGAFDAVMPGRLRRRLLEQGWPRRLADWAFSFATGRTAVLSLDDQLSAPYRLLRGIPQGSPVSPILFMLYIAPLHRLPLRSKIFGYADDVALLATGRLLRDCTQDLGTDVREAIAWGRENGISFDPAKTELIHLTKRPTSINPDLTLACPDAASPAWTVQATPTNGAIRWLGVWFDRRLSFQTHARKAKKKGLTVTTALRSLSCTTRGVPPQAARAAAVACVLPTCLYASETWWPVSSTSDPGNARDGTTGLAAAVDSVLYAAARAILPVYRTTPRAALLREAGIPPARAWLDEASARMALRIQRLDSWHPLRVRAGKWENRPTGKLRLGRALELLPRPIEKVLPLRFAPWATLETSENRKEAVGFSGMAKRNAATAFSTWVQQRPPQDLLIYTDGSKLANGWAGAGWVGFQGGREVFRGDSSFQDCAEICDAEAMAAVGGLLYARRNPPPGNVFICLDNLQVATQLGQLAGVTSSQGVFDSARALVRDWPGLQPQFRWCPGHMSLKGNELADSIAKAAAARPAPKLLYSLAAARRIIRRRKWEAAQQAWCRSMPKAYEELGLRADKIPKELALPRFALGKLLASRSGHGDFAAYHDRFKHEDALCQCLCGEDKSTSHFFFCKRPSRRDRLWGPPEKAIRHILSTFEGALKFETWVRRSRFYELHCPAQLPLANRQEASSSP